VSLPPPPAVSVPPPIPPPPGHEPEAIPSVPDARPSRAPLVLGILLVAAFFGTGALLWSWATRPALCNDANVTSERFGYCITAPPEWRLAEPVGGDLPSDQLIRLDANTTLMIQAVETGRDLPAYADDVRRLQADNGLRTEEMRAISVAGVDALEWDATLGSSGAVRARTVVFERDGVAWRLQFADSAKAFDTHVGDLAQMLRSWQFR
jgi:hypothetical protein